MPKTLLLADDSVTIQKVVGISFANEDVVLLTVDNGDDAIARAREARPDVVLADVVMPGKNGYDVCQAIKSDPALAHIPVLLLTGTFEAFDEQRAARAGADGHITKPFEAQALVDKVNALLERPAAGQAPAPAEPRVQRPAAPPPQPVSHTADTAYDFFDEEVTAPRSADAPAPSEPPAPDTTVVVSAPAEPAPLSSFDAGFELEAETERGAQSASAPESATSFGSDELELGSGSEDASLFDDFSAPAAEAEAEPARGSEPTWPEPARSSEPAWSEPAPGSETAQPSEPAWQEPAAAASAGWETPPTPWEAPSPAASAAFGFDPEPQPTPEPAAASPFDWESVRSEQPETAQSDTPDWFTVPAAPAPPPSPQDRPAAAAPAASDAPAGFGAFELEEAIGQHAAFGSAVADPAGAHDYDVSSSDLGPPLAAPPPAEPARAPAAPDIAGAASEAPASAASRPLAERERRELHDALEKMAWEAFGPVAENLVREAVDRIERIAWEVIPQLAESLIKEEIRKLKGE